MKEKVMYRNHKIETVCEDNAENPFSEWDTMPPIIVDNDGSLTGYGIDAQVPTLTRDEIIANLPDICLKLGYDNKFKMWRELNDMGEIETAIKDALYDASIYMIETLYSWKGIICLGGSSRGYSQGDYAYVLVVATPEWIKKVGAEVKKPEDLQDTIDLYSAWAWGDVYGFETDLGDSCYGFYGSDHEESGLMDAARGSIDYELEKEKKGHFKKLKAYIKNRVPFSSREVMP